MDLGISELFPDKRKENENEKTLRQAQLVDLRILRIVDYICKKHNLQYWLEGGTLLGAVRHKGFIPWDDDIDIAMTRDDYNKFFEIAIKEFPSDLFLQNFKTTEYAGNTWTQIKDRKSLMVLEENAKYHQGIYMDIFPCDSYTNNRVKRFFTERLYKQLYIKVQAINAPFKKPLFTKNNFIKNFIKFILKVVFFPFAILNHNVIYDLNIKTREKRISKMSKNAKNNYGYGTDVLNWDNIFSKDTIFPLKTMEFENNVFSVPNDWHKYLVTLYGNDYMKLPPVSKRIYHNKSIKIILSKEEEKEHNKGFYY